MCGYYMQDSDDGCDIVGYLGSRKCNSMNYGLENYHSRLNQF